MRVGEARDLRNSTERKMMIGAYLIDYYIRVSPFLLPPHAQTISRRSGGLFLLRKPVVAIVDILHDELYRERFFPTVTDADLERLARKALQKKTVRGEMTLVNGWQAA
jgi:hypothetical protein